MTVARKKVQRKALVGGIGYMSISDLRKWLGKKRTYPVNINGRALHTWQEARDYLDVMYPVQNKFGNKAVWIDNHRFPSVLEGNRYLVLKDAAARGEINELEIQIDFVLEHNGVHICKYIADFRYRKGDQTVIEDTKGKRTDEYRIKANLMLALLGIKIREVASPGEPI